MPEKRPLNSDVLARRLLALETRSRVPAGKDGEAACRVCEKLRVSLGRLVGVAGYRALFSRALAQAGAEVPWLRALRVKPNGALQGFSELEERPDSKRLALGEAVLVARLLELLATLIGPTLTLQLVVQLWPSANLDDLKPKRDLIHEEEPENLRPPAREKYAGQPGQGPYP